MKTIAVPFSIAFLFGLAASCATEDPETLAPSEDVQSRHQDAPPPLHAHGPEHSDKKADSRTDKVHAARVSAPMPNAREGFEEIAALLEAHYVDGPLSEDELWTAAIDGVMARLIQHGDHTINALLRPEDLAELKIGTEGRLVGIGVMIERVADVVVVRGVLPDSPAQKAGLDAGDRILGIDGERLKGKSLRDVVDAIRGDEGSTLDLFVQRDTEEWTATLTRHSIAVSNVEGRILETGVGYVRVRGYAANTVEEFDATMATLAEEGMTRLVLDLRGCPGGLLQAALDMTDRFLAPGQRIVTIRGRDHSEKHLLSETEDPWETLPVVVLTDRHTASGAEILADALSHHDRARIVGETTFGKGTVESIHELSDGWALKLSVSRFLGPGGEPRLGRGVNPDLHIPATSATEHVELDEIDVQADPPLRAALELLAN